MTQLQIERVRNFNARLALSIVKLRLNGFKVFFPCIWVIIMRAARMTSDLTVLRAVQYVYYTGESGQYILSRKRQSRPKMTPGRFSINSHFKAVFRVNILVGVTGKGRARLTIRTRSRALSPSNFQIIPIRRAVGT